MSGDTKDETKVSEDTKNEDNNNKEPKDDAVAEVKSKAATAATQDAGEAEPTKESTEEMPVETAAIEKADSDDSMKTEDDKPATSAAEVKVEGDGKLLKDLDDEAPKVIFSKFIACVEFSLPFSLTNSISSITLLLR
jgi:hypothetical protein